jgi:hypothetical protein
MALTYLMVTLFNDWGVHVNKYVFAGDGDANCDRDDPGMTDGTKSVNTLRLSLTSASATVRVRFTVTPRVTWIL